MERSDGRKNGVPIKEPDLNVAFQYKNMMDMGMDVSLDDIPSLYVYDLLQVIHGQEMRLKKEKQEEMERKARQAG